MNEEILARITKLEDQEDIKRLLYQYTDFLDARDYSADAVKEIFSEDGIIRFPTGSTGKGYDGVAEAHQKIMALFVSTNHNVSNAVISSYTPEQAEVHAHMHVFHKFVPEIAEKAAADLFVVNDRICALAVKTEQGWRLKQFEIEAIYTTLDNHVEELPIAPPVAMDKSNQS